MLDKFISFLKVKASRFVEKHPVALLDNAYTEFMAEELENYKLEELRTLPNRFNITTETKAKIDMLREFDTIIDKFFYKILFLLIPVICFCVLCSMIIGSIAQNTIISTTDILIAIFVFVMSAGAIVTILSNLNVLLTSLYFYGKLLNDIAEWLSPQIMCVVFPNAKVPTNEDTN